MTRLITFFTPNLLSKNTCTANECDNVLLVSVSGSGRVDDVSLWKRLQISTLIKETRCDSSSTNFQVDLLAACKLLFFIYFYLCQCWQDSDRETIEFITGKLIHHAPCVPCERKGNNRRSIKLIRRLKPTHSVV